ncbi:hypothetical protein, variant [Phialophora macrospora]|uniref:Uncharacterized protein n=1 Tax=Phialophora macrospora TaxID=1851006 RepID=A0A0D2FBH6_9EURO|nr:hypothetical protein PV04_09167 [Phialophora macrospora]KIW64216.1 hypothetical protein, variant [Phialophora macrospora]
MGLSPFIVHHTSTVRLTRSHHTLHPPHPPHARHQDLNMKRSPHSDPGPRLLGNTAEDEADPGPGPDLDLDPDPNSQQQQRQQQQQQQPSLQQWNLVLDTIRSNLNLIAATWGRRSRQYDEARGVMLAYLEDNLGRLRLREGGGNDGGGGGMAPGLAGTEAGEAVGHDGKGDADMDMATLEKGIEELMGELRI